MLLSCAAFSVACAADRPVKFPVATAQIQALGIRTAPLQEQKGEVHATFPALVAVPLNAELVVSSPVAGMVAQLLVQPNQPVRAGMPLARISSPELGQLQMQLLQANARATLARQTARREQQLYDEGIIAQRRVQEAQAALKEADAAFQQAKAALRLGGMSAATINRIAASGKPEDSLILTAPRSGTVTQIAVKPGQRVDAATALLHVVQSDSLWLEIQVPVAESGNWKPGARVKVQGRDIAARIVSIGADASSDSQTVVLRAAIEGKTALVRPGEFVTVELPMLSAQDEWDVPLSAVAHDGGQAYLFIRTADGFEARPVKIIASAGQRLRVQGQVKSGDQIAVSGVVALKGAWLDAKERK